MSLVHPKILMVVNKNKFAIKAELEVGAAQGAKYYKDPTGGLWLGSHCYEFLTYRDDYDGMSFKDKIVALLDSGKYENWYLHHSVPNATSVVNDIWMGTGYIFSVHGPLYQ